MALKYTRALDRLIRQQRAEKDESPKLSIAISREAGSRGGSIAKLVGAKLGWEVYDQDLLEYLAGNNTERTTFLDSQPEELKELLELRLQSALRGDPDQRDSHVENLMRVILAIGLQGRSVIVGRGSPFVLPPEVCLRVRCIGSEKERVTYLSQLERRTPTDARQAVIERDTRRRDFVDRCFSIDNSDPHQYDLIIDGGSFGEDTSAEIIVMALNRMDEFRRKSETLPGRSPFSSDDL